MKELRVMIVDDEPLAHRVLEDYCKKVAGLRVVENCYDGMAAFNRLRMVEVDLVLLDVRMPDLNGMELLDSLGVNAPKIILITAYTRYAVEGFDYDQVVDYLHKPVKITRFIKAIRRVRNLLLLEDGLEEEIPEPPAEYLLLKTENRSERLALTEIRYVQAWGNYVRLHLTDGRQRTVRRTMKSLEHALPAERFQRIHKSYVVQVACVAAIEANEVVLGELRLPLGKSYRQLARRVILG